MSELSGPADRGLMRVSDADREQAAEVLREAAGQGRITMAELDERLELAYAAKTVADLTAVTHDLPKPGTEMNPVGTATPSRIGGTPRHSFSVAIMSGARRAGQWVVPRNYVSVAIMGGVELDLREAQFSEPVVTLHAYALMGGIEITVPEDVEVDAAGFALMGGFDHASGPGAPGAPLVKVVGFALMGGIEVRRRPLKPKKNKKRRDALGNGPGTAIPNGPPEALED